MIRSWESSIESHLSNGVDVGYFKYWMLRLGLFRRFFMTTISSSCHFQREICGLHTWTKHYLTRVEIWCDNQKFLPQPWFVCVCVCVWCNKLRAVVWLTCIWQETDVRRQIFRLASSGMTLFVYMLRPLCPLVLIVFKSHGSKLHNNLDECYSWNLFETQFSLRPSIFSATSEYNCPRPVNFFSVPAVNTCVYYAR